jgi:pimeloyl-ACP methyl ester carboxylesterase
MWDPQWEVLQRERTVVRCDLRGFGSTPLLPGEYSHAGDLIELLDELQLGPAAVVGASMGGGVSLQVALARPDLVSALVLIGTGVRGHQWSEHVTRAWDEEDAALARGDVDAAVEVNLRTWVDGPHRSPDEVDAGLRRRLGEMQRHAFELGLESHDAKEGTYLENAADRLAEVAVPTLVIVGEHDRLTPPEDAQRIAEGVVGARLVTIDQAGHMSNLENPEAFNTALLQFLRDQHFVTQK